MSDELEKAKNLTNKLYQVNGLAEWEDMRKEIAAALRRQTREALELKEVDALYRIINGLKKEEHRSQCTLDGDSCYCEMLSEALSNFTELVEKLK